MSILNSRIPLLALTVASLLAVVPSCGDHDNGNHAESAESGKEKLHEGHDHSGLINLDHHRAGEFGVATEKITSGDFSSLIPVSGQIESRATDEAAATATRSGILSLSPDVNSGVRVAAGASIGSVRSADVQGGDPSVQAITARDAAKRELDRLKPLHEDGIVSTQTYNKALADYENAQAALRGTKQGSAAVTSPKSGVITQLLAKSGDYVEAGQRVAVVSGNTHLTLRADVPEKYVMQLSGVRSANFRAASSGDTYSIDELGGKMLSNPGAVVAVNGYIPLYFSFANNGKVAPGAYAEIFLKSSPRQDVLSVPKEAIVEINGNKCVYTRHGEDLYEKHVVHLGASDGKRVEIVSGLEPGKDVVVKGAQVIRMAETSATAVPGHSHSH